MIQLFKESIPKKYDLIELKICFIDSKNNKQRRKTSNKEVSVHLKEMIKSMETNYFLIAIK